MTCLIVSSCFVVFRTQILVMNLLFCVNWVLDSTLHSTKKIEPFAINLDELLAVKLKSLFLVP